MGRRHGHRVGHQARKTRQRHQRPARYAGPRGGDDRSSSTSDQLSFSIVRLLRTKTASAGAKFRSADVLAKS
jgi:hypothetical protein